RLRNSSPDAATRLRNLAATVAGEGGGSLDPAIRAWALHDPVAADALGQVDAERLSFIQRGFAALRFDPAAARTRARLFYLHLLGEHALALADRPLSGRLAEAERVLDLLLSA